MDEQTRHERLETLQRIAKERFEVTDQDQTEQIKSDVAALQEASAAAADQIAELTDQVLALQAGTITDDQITNLHNALQETTSALVDAVSQSEEALPETDEPGRTEA